MNSVNSSGAGGRLKQGSKASSSSNKKITSSDINEATSRNESKQSAASSAQHSTASSSLKSSVKRLFSPSNSSKSQQVVNTPGNNTGQPIVKPVSSKKALVMPKSSSSTDKGIGSSFSSKSISSTSSHNVQVNTNHSIDSSSSYNNLTQDSLTGSVSSKTFITTNKILESPNSNSSFITTASISRSFTNTSNMQALPEATLSNTSSITDSSLTSLSIRVSDRSEPSSKTGSSQVNKNETKPIKKAINTTKQANSTEKSTTRNATAGGTLKKHLNILKSNSKKVLLGTSTPNASVSSGTASSRAQVTNKPKTSSSSMKNSSTLNNISPRSNLSGSLLSTSPGSTNSKSSLAKNSTQFNSERKVRSSKQIDYDKKIQELSNEISTSNQQTNDSKSIIDQLQTEIERLNNLYDYEINNKKSHDDDKLHALKQVAEEKQIESAAIKFEYRKIQEIKENLSAENNLLKSFLNSINLNPSNLPSPTSLSCKLVKKVSSAQSSPTSSFNSPRQQTLNISTNSPNFNPVQQAAAVAAAAAAVNAHTVTNQNTSSSNLENGSGSFETNIHGNQHSYQIHNQQQPQQYYHLNSARSHSPPPSLSLQKNPYNLSSQQHPPPLFPPSIHQQQQQLQNSSTSSLSNSNLKQQQQLHFQQQQQNNVAAAAAAASAAAEFYEQQMKIQQHKNLDMEQQFRVHLDQLKELKDTVNNLNEMNRKLYDENQQFKERNLEQRQQIEHYHVLFQENQQKAEQTLNQARKERDEAYQNETEFKHRMQIQIESKQQESFMTINTLKEKLDCLTESEIHLTQELNTTKTQLNIEKNRNDSLEKKTKMLEKECCLLKDSWESERASLNNKIADLSIQLEASKKQYSKEKLRVDEKNMDEKNELTVQLKELELKIEEVVKEKAHINYKYGQLVADNRNLNNVLQEQEQVNMKKNEDLKNNIDFYVNKCKDLEKEISTAQETHEKDTEEWKKFQADLQTAVRVANDFMIEAEEKMNKMKEDYTLTKEKESHMTDEIEKLKKKLNIHENNNNKQSLTFLHSKQNKENESNIVLTPLQLNNPESSTYKLSSNYKHNSTSQIGISTNSTDTDDAKIFSSRVSNQTQILFSTPYIAKNDFLTQNEIARKPVNAVKASSSSSLMDSANLIHNTNMSHANSDALANLVKQYGVSKRNALIKWCQERLSTYSDVEIKNFSSSWNDGLAFCALMDSFLGNKLDYETLKSENNPRKNFQTAFKIAQTVGIQQTLNINDLLNNERPDWNAVMNYVASIYRHFEGPTKTDETELSTPILKNYSKNKTTHSAITIPLTQQTKNNTRSSSSSPTSLRNLSSSVQNTIPMSLSASTTSTTSNASSFSASSSSSSISKTIN